jgi:thioredoxin 1
MAHESIIDLTSENFEAEVKNATGPVLVDFWAEWCGPCKMIAPVLDEIASEKGDAVKICKVNLETEGNNELASQFGVSAIPTLVFFKDGEKIDQHSGLLPKDAITQKLDALA